jgi:hypothetical protein
MAERIYRTADGKHVGEGHPDAAYLAYSQYDKAPKAVLDELEDGKPKAKPAEDKAAKPANKQAKPADK